MSYDTSIEAANERFRKANKEYSDAAREMEEKFRKTTDEISRLAHEAQERLFKHSRLVGKVVSTSKALFATSISCDQNKDFVYVDRKKLEGLEKAIKDLEAQ